MLDFMIIAVKDSNRSVCSIKLLVLFKQWHYDISQLFFFSIDNFLLPSSLRLPNTIFVGSNAVPSGNRGDSYAHVLRNLVNRQWSTRKQLPNYLCILIFHIRIKTT